MQQAASFFQRVFLILCTLTLLNQAEADRADAMNYRILEEYYGPQIRFNDWRVTRGEIPTDHVFRQTRGIWQPSGQGVSGLFSSGGSLQIYATEPVTVTRQDYIFGGGGDVELRLTFEVERIEPSGSFSVRFNDARTGSGGENGFRVTITPGRAAFFYRDKEVAAAELDTRRGISHHLVLVTLAEEYEFVLNEKAVFTGKMEPNSQDNEGWMHLDVVDAGIRIQSFAESFIAHDVAFSEWERKELLYEETFGPESWRNNWVLNGEEPEVSEESFVFRPMSNVIIDRRFNGPIAIDVEATPMPTDEHSMGITDAIFIWMMDHPDGDLPGYMRNLPDAGRGHYLPLPFYWMDFGGTNNVTTRFRRSPNLRMIRQFTDAPRLMERDRTYQITLVQNENSVEFWVDGDRWIQAWDPEPLNSGYIGHRAFNSHLRISGIKVWRIE